MPSRRKWNPRYRFYARVNGRTPQGQLDHDAPVGGSGIYKFSLWVRAITQEYKASCERHYCQGGAGLPGFWYTNDTPEGLAKFIKDKYPKIKIAW